MTAVKGPRSVLLGAVLGLALAVLVNGLIFSLGFGQGGQDPAGADPGPVNRVIFAIVPFVWLGLFSAMGAAIALLRRAADGSGAATILTAVLLANCTLYPLYTNGFQAPDAGLAGNYVTALMAVAATTAAWPTSRIASGLIAPVAVWVTLASIGLYATQTGRTF